MLVRVRVLLELTSLLFSKRNTAQHLCLKRVDVITKRSFVGAKCYDVRASHFDAFNGQNVIWFVRSE